MREWFIMILLPKHLVVWEHRVIITDKICMVTTRLACNQAIESSYWRMDNNGCWITDRLCALPVTN
jgi:hypothetical protein